MLRISGSGWMFTILVVIFGAKCSGNYRPVRNNFGSNGIALQSSRTWHWLIVYKDVGLLLIGGWKISMAREFVWELHTNRRKGLTNFRTVYQTTTTKDD